MRVIVSGGTGFLGRALCASLAEQQHEVVVLTRSDSVTRATQPVGGSIAHVPWAPDGNVAAWASVVENAGAVVNLAGASIGARRWTAAEKTRIRESRLLATRSLVTAIRGASQPPAVFVSGSAVGYYGSRGAEVLTEQSPAGSDFLASVCVAWEAEALAASSPSTRVVLIRTGLALDRGTPALDKMALPFKLFAGGPVGSGRQYMSWIHRADWVGLVTWAMSTPTLRGPLNATAPGPVTNAEFSATLGRALRRPSWLPAPAPALRLLLGEMADALLLSSQRAIPARANELGVRFRYEHLDAALRAIYGSG
jgi:uncharacterized protein (TIGR01777 family)